MLSERRRFAAVVFAGKYERCGQSVKRHSRTLTRQPAISGMSRLKLGNKIICKTRMIIHLKVLFMRIKKNSAGKKTHGEEDWTDELPADPPVEARPVPQHGVDVVTKVLETVEPGHSNSCHTGEKSISCT
jgi:hypothetical protein